MKKPSNWGVVHKKHKKTFPQQESKGGWDPPLHSWVDKTFPLLPPYHLLYLLFSPTHLHPSEERDLSFRLEKLALLSQLLLCTHASNHHRFPTVKKYPNYLVELDIASKNIE
ncbi:hypothetical protein CDAR_461431 [Caerostris darwini]|uniref:Uncharacterized protein n=1 Tax=Caerostris darwini TaxID=1538125 RepID=A0AAV4NEK1_9ARAC|nr:hypothetical protein CDAR_461431 [Caerostris darwini]